MNRERLLNVAKALRESAAPECFGMGSYATACGTPACALGHYASRPDLQRALGLTAIRGEEGFLCMRGTTLQVSYDGNTVTSHFDIDEDTAELLFGPDGCAGAATAREAAQYIEVYAARGGESE